MNDDPAVTANTSQPIPAEVAPSRPVILVFTRNYLPGFRAGGPVRSIANLTSQLHREFEFLVITRDRDVGDSTPYPTARRREWVRCGNTQIMYVDTTRQPAADITHIVETTPHDAIYLNSFFDVRFTRPVLFDRRWKRAGYKPVVLAPRGEFSRGALRIKHWRKRLGMRIADQIGMYDGLTWQASSKREEAEIREALGAGWFARHGGRIVVAGNVPGLSLTDVATLRDNAHGHSSNGSDSPFRVCFLSRISRKKNLDFALRVLTLTHARIDFTIYGPRDDAYWATCEPLIRELPANIRATYGGAIPHDKVAGTLAAHDLFFLPTLGENYGHAIAEALRAGLPVLISDQTPWRGLADAGAGWDLPLGDPAAFAARLDEAAIWTREDKKLAARSARTYLARTMNEPVIIDANRRLFLDAIRNRSSSD